MEKTFFSIITCTKNSAKYLRNNIKSVQNQTYKNFEHIFVDGFSEDKTVGLIKKYRARHPSVVSLYQSKPKGISNAMNIGISKAKGEYILILHSDDSLYMRDVLTKTYFYLREHPEFDWIYGKINVVEENGKSIGQYPARWIYKYFPRYFLKFYNTIPHQATFMKKLIFKKFGGFDESLTSAMDIDLWLRIRNKTNWHFFNKVISNYMVRKGAQSSGLIRKFENDNNAIEVRKRYLNVLEIAVFRMVKRSAGLFTKTYR
jgi:glycosyltransferase involved in cell wall biosynthesis